MRRPRHLLPYGPTALLLNWEQKIDPAISKGVNAYAEAIRQLPGVCECIPAYASLLISFDPATTNAYLIGERIFDLDPSEKQLTAGLRHELPVFYDGPDMEYVLRKLRMSKEELIELHTGRDYLVYQLGFQPGFAFLGDTAARLRIERRPEPRRRVPAGSVGLADRQTGIYPVQCPGGWQLIGRCPWPMLRASDGAVRLRAGDQVCFRSVGAAEFSQLQKTSAPWTER